MSGKTNLASAPGTYLGFALQPVRLCFHLLNGKADDVVSIETDDDIEVQSGNEVILEQTKSALTQNPVSDLANDLWKSFANWIALIDNGTVDPEVTTFRLYVTPVKTGEIVEMLHAAKTNAAADQCVKHIQAVVDSLASKPYCYRYLRKLLELDETSRRALIRNFEFESVHVDPVDAIRNIIKVPISPEIVDKCAAYAIGDAKEQADALIRDGLPPSITAGPFQVAFKAFVKANDLTRLLTPIAPQPTQAQVDATYAGSPPFVRQLEFIELSQEQRLRAVSNYLQASADKTHWAEKGYVFHDSLKEFDKSLIQAHGFLKLQLDDHVPPYAPPALGRQLYARCCSSAHKLEGRETPSHFIPGCFNDLANRSALGWHPDYVALLEKVEK